MAPRSLAAAFGRLLREYREKSGMSQERLALEAGIDRTYVSLLERGLRQPTLDTLFRLARTLKVAPATLIGKLAAAVGR